MLSCFRLIWLFVTPWTASSPPGSSVRGILQARTLEWDVMPSSRGSSWRKDWTHTFYVSCIVGWVIYHSRHLGNTHPVKFTNLTFITLKCMIQWHLVYSQELFWWLSVKNLPANAGDARDLCLIPGSRRSPGEGNGNPLQYSCLGNPMDRGALQALVWGIAKESDMT